MKLAGLTMSFAMRTTSMLLACAAWEPHVFTETRLVAVCLKNWDSYKLTRGVIGDRARGMTIHIVSSANLVLFANCCVLLALTFARLSRTMTFRMPHHLTGIGLV